MAQLTIYLDERTLKKISAAARRSRESVSRWVKSRLAREIETGWPPGYFDLFGCLADTDFKRPSQGDFSTDVRRKPL